MATYSPSVREHHVAVLTYLRNGSPAGFPVYDSTVEPYTWGATSHGQPTVDPDGRMHPYAVMYSEVGRSLPVALEGISTALRWGFTVICVGGDENRCLWAVDTVVRVLVDAEVSVAGRDPVLVRQEIASPSPRRDDDIKPPRLFVPVFFRADSQAA